MQVALSDIQAAQERIAPYIHTTEVGQISTPAGGTFLVKAESLQITGSFKTRGAFNRILLMTQEERAKGIIASSAGNHAQGVARAAQAFGIPCTIVMPRTAPLAKISAVRAYGSNVVLHGEVYDDAYAKAIEIMEETGASFIHPFDDPAIIAGQGTIGLEIAKQVPDLETLVVPVGGGGLAAGVALAMKALLPSVRVIGVEPENAASMQASIQAQKIVTLASAATIADGIAVKTPGQLTYKICREVLDDVVTVDDDEIASAMLYMLEKAKIVSEGAGAASTAAVLYGRVPCKGKTLAIISGGNIDATMISRIIDKGLAKAGRKILLKVVILDRPGQLAKLLDLVSETGANVVSIHHDRIRTDISIGHTIVELELETRDREHALSIHSLLEDKKYRLMG